MSKTQGQAVEIRDFQSFLQKCLGCKQLELIDLSATKMLPPGQNFSSEIVKLDATIRRVKGAVNETLHFVAKVNNNTEEPIGKWSDFLLKEVFMYTQLIPAYEKLGRELGAQLELDFFPKYIGHRCSLNYRYDIVDEDSILVLENLSMHGFYTIDKRIGINFDHTRKALISIAKFHALGIALKSKNPDLFKTALAQAQVKNVNWKPLDDGFDSILQTFRDNGDLNKHLPIIESTFAQAKNGNMWLRETIEPWATIIHGDFWVSNMMFHKDEEGRVDNLKLIDFQTYMYHSPLKDLPGLLCCNLEETTKINHMAELLDLYHENFTRSLERMGCDAKPFAREAFDRELKRQAIIQFPMCALSFKFIVAEIKEDNANVVFANQVTNDVIQHLKKLIEIYEKNGWM